MSRTRTGLEPGGYGHDTCGHPRPCRGPTSATRRPFATRMTTRSTASPESAVVTSWYRTRWSGGTDMRCRPSTVSVQELIRVLIVDGSSRTDTTRLPGSAPSQIVEHDEGSNSFLLVGGTFTRPARGAGTPAPADRPRRGTRCRTAAGSPSPTISHSGKCAGINRARSRNRFSMRPDLEVVAHDDDHPRSAVGEVRPDRSAVQASESGADRELRRHSG